MVESLGLTGTISYEHLIVLGVGDDLCHERALLALFSLNENNAVPIIAFESIFARSAGQSSILGLLLQGVFE